MYVQVNDECQLQSDLHEAYHSNTAHFDGSVIVLEQFQLTHSLLKCAMTEMMVTLRSEDIINSEAL